MTFWEWVGIVAFVWILADALILWGFSRIRVRDLRREKD